MVVVGVLVVEVREMGEEASLMTMMTMMTTTLRRLGRKRKRMRMRKRTKGRTCFRYLHRQGRYNASLGLSKLMHQPSARNASRSGGRTNLM